MKIFLDTGSLEEIKSAFATGILDGVTTNPTLIAKEGKDFESVIGEIGTLFDSDPYNKDGVVNAEVVSTDSAQMVAEAKRLSALHKRVVVKIPMIQSGIRAVRELSALGIRTNVTLCFSATQALLAAKAGATFVSPFIGRIDDINQRGLDLIDEMRTMYDNYGFETEILAASIRSARQVVEVALLGADVVTVPYKVFEQLFLHPLTDSGLKKFLSDWEGYQKTLTQRNPSPPQ